VGAVLASSNPSCAHDLLLTVGLLIIGVVLLLFAVVLPAVWAKRERREAALEVIRELRRYFRSDSHGRG
jgi:hypothetical protein